MVSIEWCIRNKNGIEIISPNKNMSDSYIKMAEESIGVLNSIEKSRIWTATTSYYIFYYSLYALMLRIGIKCEIHSCSLEFMRAYLTAFYSKKDIEMIEKAFSARIDLQYYSDRPVDENIISETRRYCKDFYIKTQGTLAKITESEVNEIRAKLGKEQQG
ncbi:MAG: hypothetical protein AABX74_02105 [Nanoarchaeota archaeon]